MILGRRVWVERLWLSVVTQCLGCYIGKLTYPLLQQTSISWGTPWRKTGREVYLRNINGRFTCTKGNSQVLAGWLLACLSGIDAVDKPFFSQQGFDTMITSLGSEEEKYQQQLISVVLWNGTITAGYHFAIPVIGQPSINPHLLIVHPLVRRVAVIH